MFSLILEKAQKIINRKIVYVNEKGVKTVTDKIKQVVIDENFDSRLGEESFFSVIDEKKIKHQIKPGKFIKLGK